jgi:membrane-bound lytic murein transglycosylase D
MTVPQSRLSIAIWAAALLLTSCETANQKHASSSPPLQATAPALAATTVTAKTPAPLQAEPQPQMPSADPIESLIAQAEVLYQNGEAYYRVGQPEAGKQNFDDALGLLNSAPADIRSNQRVQAEANKISARSHDLDLEASNEAEAAPIEQKAEPAPIDEANEAQIPVDEKVKAKAEAELKAIHSDLPLVMNDYVAGYINYYSTRGQAVLQRALSRAGRYRDMVQRIFSEEGVPQDLIYLAQAESGFQPFALSRAGARGMWQFMTSRARAYGLQHNAWVDERQDPEKSTRAAARHLKELYQQFGDWYLAMAAYNSGPGNVQQAVQRTGFADFWELYRRNVLPKETKNYVPIILAMTIIAKNPAQYGLPEFQPDPPLNADRVKIDYPLDLRLAAGCIGTTLETLQDLNPSLLRYSTPKTGTFTLNLPAGSAQRFQENIAAIPVEKRIWWRYHKVASGETLSSIAQHYRVAAKSITEVNGLDASEISPDTNLIIPLAVGRHAPGDAETLVFSRHPTRYKVRRGDTITSVAEDFNVPADRLRRWNRIHGDSLRAGRSLVIYRPLTRPEPASLHRSKSKRAKKLQAASAPAKKTPAATAAPPSTLAAGTQAKAR